ncbi:3-dehydroquinate synthase, partial [Streptomyces sp. NPDC059894]
MARADGGAAAPVRGGGPRGRGHRRPRPRRRRPSGPRRTGVGAGMTTRIHVGGSAGSEPYEVLIGRRLLGELGAMIGDRARR